MSQYITPIAIFRDYLPKVADRLWKKYPHHERPITSVDFITEIAKDGSSQIMEGLIEISEVDRDVFISSMEKFAENYSEIPYRTFIDEEYSTFSQKFKNSSGGLANYLKYAHVLSLKQGKQFVTCEEFVRAFFKSPPLEFIYFLEEEELLNVAVLYHYFKDIEEKFKK